MRTLVKISYLSSGALELRRAGEFQTGEVYQTISPNEIFSVGNSIGGFWAKPVLYAGQNLLSLIHVSGSEKGMALPELRRRKIMEKGFILFPEKVGLWADSSGAARNGIFHLHTPPADVLEEALVGYGKKLIKRVATISAEAGTSWNCSHYCGPGAGHYQTFEADGAVEEVEEHVGADCVQRYQYSNAYHARYGSTCYKVSGGTFLIKKYAENPTEVFVTPSANLPYVADIIRLGREAAEKKFGFRCTECSTLGCSPAVHEQEAREAAAHWAKKIEEDKRQKAMFPSVTIDGKKYIALKLSNDIDAILVDEDGQVWKMYLHRTMWRFKGSPFAPCDERGKMVAEWTKIFYFVSDHYKSDKEIKEEVRQMNYRVSDECDYFRSWPDLAGPLNPA